MIKWIGKHPVGAILVFVACVGVARVGQGVYEILCFQPVRWEYERYREFCSLGDELINAANENNGDLSAAMETFARREGYTQGLLQQYDTAEHVAILRQLRAVPTISLDGELIIMVETFEPPRRHAFIYRLKGVGLAARPEELHSVIAQDNERRQRCGLSPIEFGERVVTSRDAHPAQAEKGDE